MSRDTIELDRELMKPLEAALQMDFADDPIPGVSVLDFERVAVLFWRIYMPQWAEAMYGRSGAKVGSIFDVYREQIRARCKEPGDFEVLEALYAME